MRDRALYCRKCDERVLPRDIDTMLSYFQQRYSKKYSLHIIQYVMNHHRCAGSKTGLDAFL